MGTSGACSNKLGQRLEELAQVRMAKGWLGGLSVFSAVPGHRRGEYLHERTAKMPLGTRKGPVVLEGGTGGIICKIQIAYDGEVEIRLSGLPEVLRGRKLFLSFPAASFAKGVAWAPGPSMGIVQSNDVVSPNDELRCMVARSRSQIGDLPRLFRLVGIFSEAGNSQPACSVRLDLNPCVEA